MHNAALAELARADARFASWRYFKFEVTPEKLPLALDLFHARGFLGLNLTVPHKVIAFARVAAATPTSRRSGRSTPCSAARRRAPGLAATPTAMASPPRLHEELNATLTGAHVILLGAGAPRAAPRWKPCGAVAPRCGSPTAPRPGWTIFWPGCGRWPPQCRCTVSIHFRRPPTFPPARSSSTPLPLGLQPGDAAPIDLARLPRPAGVYDMIYNPPKTALLRQAAALGVPYANGLSMLVHQGAKSLEIWSGVSAERTAPAMKRAARVALAPD